MTWHGLLHNGFYIRPLTKLNAKMLAWLGFIFYYHVMQLQGFEPTSLELHHQKGTSGRSITKLPQPILMSQIVSPAF